SAASPKDAAAEPRMHNGAFFARRSIDAARTRTFPHFTHRRVRFRRHVGDLLFRKCQPVQWGRLHWKRLRGPQLLSRHVGAWYRAFLNGKTGHSGFTLET